MRTVPAPHGDRVRTRLAAWLVLVCLATAAASAFDAAGAREAAERFGHALEQRDSGAIAASLPQRGRVRLQLERLVGRERGFFSNEQVVTLLRTFLQEGSVEGFVVTAIDSPAEQFARVDARARITNHKGVTRPAMLRMTLELEGNRWVVRELRESGS